MYGFDVYQPKKRKNKPADHNTESTYRTISQGCREVDNSSFQTPISGKGGKGQRASRDTSCDIVHPQTPLSIVGEHSCLGFYAIGHHMKVLLFRI